METTTVQPKWIIYNYRYFTTDYFSANIFTEYYSANIFTEYYSDVNYI